MTKKQHGSLCWTSCAKGGGARCGKSGVQHTENRGKVECQQCLDEMGVHKCLYSPESCAGVFHRLFRLDLRRYFVPNMPQLGFDLLKFDDDAVVVKKNESTEIFLRRVYGEEAVKLISALINCRDPASTLVYSVQELIDKKLLRK